MKHLSESILEAKTKSFWEIESGEYLYFWNFQKDGNKWKCIGDATLLITGLDSSTDSVSFVCKIGKTNGIKVEIPKESVDSYYNISEDTVSMEFPHRYIHSTEKLGDNEALKLCEKFKS